MKVAIKPYIVVNLNFSKVQLFNSLFSMSLMLILSHSIVLDSLQPLGLQPIGLLCPWDFSVKNIGSSCHSLLQGIPGIEPTSSVSPALQVDYYQLSHRESLLCYRRSTSVCVCVCVCVCVSVCVCESLSHVWFFVTPWTEAPPDSSLHGILR